jgi:hypothetical protein
MPPSALQDDRQDRFCLIFFIVAWLNRDGRTIPRRSPFTKVMSALSIAMSVPVPIAMPTCACSNAGTSLTPSHPKSYIGSKKPSEKKKPLFHRFRN